MAITSNSYTGNGSTTLYSFTFPYLDESHVKVSLNGTLTTAYTFANATTIQFNTAPGVGVAILIYRQTDDSALEATFFAGSSIKAQDLNENFLQSIYINQEVNNRALDSNGDTMSGILNMGGYKITNLGTPTLSTDAATKAYVDATAFDGIADESLTDIKVSPTAAISGTKITPHFGNQYVESSAYFAAKDHGEVRFYEHSANGNQHLALKAPAALSNNVTWTLPGTDTAIPGYALTSDGAGTLSWGRAGGATGGGSDSVFYENSQTVTTNYTISAGKNAMSAGPVTVNPGIIVTIPSGSSWSIV